MDDLKKRDSLNYYTEMLVVGSKDEDEQMSDSEFDYKLSREDTDIERLKSRIMELQEELSNQDDLKGELQFYRDEIKEKAYLAADNIRKAFTEKHQKEMKRKIELHAEEEKVWCENRLQLEEDLFKSEQSFKSVKEENIKLTNEIKDLQSKECIRESEYNETVNALNEKASNLINELHKYKEISKRNHYLEQEQKALQQIQTELEHRLNNLTHEKEDETAKLMEEVAAYREENFHLREENSHLKEDLNNLEIKFDKATNDLNHISRAKSQIEFEKLNLENNLKQTQIQVQCLQQEIAFMNSRHSRQSNYSNAPSNKGNQQAVLEAPLILRPPSTPVDRDEAPLCCRCGENVLIKRRSNSNGNVREESRPMNDAVNFREFVIIKRELASIKNENSILREQLRSCGFLPPLQRPQKR